jgi:hypothetical protein
MRPLLSDNTGVILLGEDGSKVYKKGARIINGPNLFTKMKADDSRIKVVA